MRPQSRPPGWGIVGASSIVRDHMAAALRSPLRISNRLATQADAGQQSSPIIVAICSANTLRARVFADALQIPHAYTNLDQMLEHPDIQYIYVANHPRDHAPAVMAALNAGKHVLCEAPLSLDVATAEELVFKADLHGLALGINAPWRADPTIQHLRRLIIDDEFGDLVGGRIMNAGLLPPAKQGWRLSPNGGGIHFDRTQRDLDLLFYLTGHQISEVYAESTSQVLGSHSKIEVPEELLSTIRLAGSGATFHLYDSFLIQHMPSAIELFGSIGHAIVSHWHEADIPTTLRLIGRDSSQAIMSTPDDPYILSVEDFVQASQAGQRPLASGNDGILALRSTLAIQRALAKHRPTTP